MKNFYLRNSGLNRFMFLFTVLLLMILGVSAFLLTPPVLAEMAGSSTGGPRMSE